ncbi:DUF6884 domain-containing protein [Clostridium botulinum]|uniref:DUF6884 domain-containing protein n=1 Tax=Clostridium botulinum TaxID=1491 RepID=UPI00217E3EC9|nr:DUF6884 domain-containing protein [Clostridium botulinum]
MATIALISCTSSKKHYACQAKELYSESATFCLEYELANILAEEIYILSAKHGLVAKDTILDYYDYTLMHKSKDIKIQWSKKVLNQIREIFSLEEDEFIILAGKDYYEYLLPSIKKYWLPLKGKRQGERQPMLRQLLAIEGETNLCKAVHEFFNQMPRMNYKTISDISFSNGIYIMFENNQKYWKVDRIVRIGTHTSNDRLKHRLRDHFISKNKDGSIFRKNIGKAILNKNNDSYLDIWSLDTSKRYNKDKINEEKEEKIEEYISNYLQKNITFVCFIVNEKEDRLRLEEALISLLNKSDDFYPGNDWLGKFSPVDKIAQSGLWLTQGLDASPLTVAEFARIKESVRFVENSYPVTNKSHMKIKDSVKDKTLKTSTNNMPINEIRAYINKLLQQEKSKGKTTYILRAGDLQKELGLVNATPTVCDAMTKKINYDYDILFAPPKGKSTKLTVKYYL